MLTVTPTLIPSDEELKEGGLTYEEAIDLITPIVMGPTWQRTPDGSWSLPERTLGWQVAGWCAEWLRGPEGDSWRFTPEQLRFVLWWYAMDEHGDFVYRRGVLQRLKGHGKDPLLAVLCLVEMVGPSRVGGWSKDGNPIGEAHPNAWVQVAAVNQGQTANTMAMMPSLMSDRFIAKYQIKPGAVLIRGMNGRVRIEAITSSPRALQGRRSTFVVLNETHEWIHGNKGHAMYQTIHANAAKVDGRHLAITNAYLPGEDSVGERMRLAYEDILEGKAEDRHFLYDTVEANPKAPLNGPLTPAILEQVRGDSIWLKIPSVLSAIADRTVSASHSRRMWFNQVWTAEESLHGDDTWDPIKREGETIALGEKIALGFDGGKTDDATALIAIRVRDGHVVPIGIWEKPDGPSGEGWEIDRDEVDRAVRETFASYEVVAFFADVALWESHIGDWAEDFGEQLIGKATGRDPISWDMRASIQRSTLAHERLLSSIFDQKITHNGNGTLRRHALNAQRSENNYGVYFRKGGKAARQKIDAYAALMLAHEAWHVYRTGKKPEKKKARTGRGYFL